MLITRPLNKAGWLALALLLTGCTGGLDAGRRIHVAADGSDQWSGRLKRPSLDRTDGPLASLKAAQQAVRKLRQERPEEPIQVVVHTGTYRLAEPLVFAAEDSGTPAAPVTYRAEGRVVLSGGEVVDGWKRESEGLWSAELSEAARGRPPFKLLRVGDRWAVRARHPNRDAQDPIKGGWLFADFHGEAWERGRFDRAVSDVHNAGDRLTWSIRIPAAGTYRVWLRYASSMKQYNVSDMGGRTALQLDNAAPLVLSNLPDTGGWDKWAWSQCAELTLPAGEHTLSWVNQQGGGLALDALALTDDPAWDPASAIGNFTWWGAFDCKPPAVGSHLLLIQAEGCTKAEGKEIKVPETTPPGITQYLRFRPGDVPAWASAAGAEVHVFPAWGWVNAIVPIERIDASEHKIIFPGGGAGQDIRSGNRYFIENVREALDDDDEWYLEVPRGRVLYRPPGGVPPQDEAIAPRLDRLIELRGGAKPVEHLRFQGFTFTDTDYASNGYYAPADAAIRMSNAAHCSISGCEFRLLGGHALLLDEGSRHIEFTANTLEDLGQGGVIMLGSPDNQPHHNLIAGNTMRRLGLICKHVAGVYCTTASDNRIVNNTMSDLTRYAVALKSYTPQDRSERNVVEFNDIRRSNLETNDTGAIETLGRSQSPTGNIIRWNLILDVVGIGTDAAGKITSPYFNWGIYLDDYSSGTTVHGNIVARTANGGICVHGGKDNLFENNVFIGAENEQLRLQPRDEFMKGNRFVRNIVVAPTAKQQLIYSWSRGSATFSEWDHNCYWALTGELATAKKLTPKGSYAEWQAAGNDAHSLIADPQFVDPMKDDYRLQAGSPALPLGFQPIPIEKIGAQGWSKAGIANCEW